jgi:ribosomal protein S18 acetylase RimI-like enzyme
MIVLDLVRPELDGLHHPEEFAPPTGASVVIRDGGDTMAGGGLRRVSDGIGEISRMWTAPRARGRGYARRVLAVLEATAIDYGYRTLRLEAATSAAAAIALYRSVGYEQIEPRGLSGDFVYFEKRLS